MGRAPTFDAFKGALNSEAVLHAARAFYEPQLAAAGLGTDAVARQDLRELRHSLELIDQAIADPGNFHTFKLNMTAQAGLIVTPVNAEAHLELGILPILLERKRQILERIQLLTPEEQLNDISAVVEEKVADPAVRDEILRVLREQAAQQQATAEAAGQIDKGRVDAALLHVEVQERKSRIYLRFLERESVATMIGAIILLVMAVALVVAMFAGISATNIVENAFLVILGYFFGQSTRSVTRSSGTEQNAQSSGAQPQASAGSGSL